MQGLQRLQNFRHYRFQDIEVARVAKVANFRLYRFQDIKVARVAKVAKFQTLSFSGYQSCKISDSIILRISRLRGLHRL